MSDPREYPKGVIDKEISASKFLHEKRIEKGYTQLDIAKYLNIDRSHYSRKEAGSVPFTAGEFLFLNELLETLPVKIKKRAISMLIPKI